MPGGRFYRGGASLRPLPDDVRFDRLSGLVKTTHGVSVYDRPDHPNLAGRGGVYVLGVLTADLRIVQRGRDPSHHEIVPAIPMSFEEFREHLDRVPLDPA